MNDLRTAAQQALEAMEYHVEQTRPIWKTSEAIAALEAALAEPVQEPVAWVVYDHENNDIAWTEAGKRLKLETPLYTAPPQSTPLTEEEIYSLFRTVASPVMFARAIEQAHGIT